MRGSSLKIIFILMLAMSVKSAFSQNPDADSTTVKIGINDGKAVVEPKGQNFALPQKTQIDRTKAGAVFRSLAFPGWGQQYVGRKKAGKAFMLTASAASCLALYAVIKHQRNIKELDESREAYNNAGSLTETIEAYDEMELKYDNAQASNVMARLSVATLSMIWGFNLIDTWLFSPDELCLRADNSGTTGDNLKIKMIIAYEI